MGLEKYSDVPRQYYANENIFDLERRWAGYALEPLNRYLHRAEAFVASVGDTVVEVGSGAAHAVLQLGQGVMAGGSQLVTKFVSAVSGGGSSLMRGLGLQGPKLMSPSPSANLVYGIGAVYRFESTAQFRGPGTLTIAYDPVEVFGFEPSDLRVYYLPDGSNRWQLVGGTVDTEAHTVSAIIYRLGTYAVAPPMPTCDLQLVPSTSTLAADGVSQMTIVVGNISLNTGEILGPPPYVGPYSGVATQPWMFTAVASGVTILNPDIDSAIPGVQTLSADGAVTLVLRAPVGGTVAHVSLASVFGDAYGTVAINLIDETPPATPAGVSLTAGQSRVAVSWQANSEPDAAGYRVYYRMGEAGPPWDGTAGIEGAPSPVVVAATNRLLRGLTLGATYFVAVGAVDTTGNESPLSAPMQVTTASGPPVAPTGLAARFGSEGENILMWALSEDDGYNDRDVLRYDVYRVVLPGNTCQKIGEVPAGVGVFTDTDGLPGAGQTIGYVVRAVDTEGLDSQAPLTFSLGNRVFRDDGAGGGTANNGTEDGSEPGIADVVVKLYAADASGNPTGNWLDTRTTDANGYYRFDNLVAGRYVPVVDVTASGAALVGLASSTVSSMDTTLAGDLKDHGQDTPLGIGTVLPAGIAAVPVTLGLGLQPIGEAAGTGAGANGPTGDAGDNLVMDFGFRTVATTAARLAYFSAVCAGSGHVQLSWGTLVEYDLLGFQVDRCPRNAGWERVTGRIIPATGWSGRPEDYSVLDANAPAVTELKYRLLGIDLRGQEFLLAEARVQPAITLAIGAPRDELCLRVGSTPNALLAVETATIVTGPWTRLQDLMLDRSGVGIVSLILDENEPGRFFRIRQQER